MFVLFVILTIISALLLIGVVLIQKSKGGGLSSSFAGSNQIMGVRRTNNFIEKVTWSLAGAIAVFAILSTYTMGGAIQTDAPRVQAAAQPVGGTNFDGGAEAATTDAAAAEATATEATTEAAAAVEETAAEAAPAAETAPAAAE